MNEYDLFNRLGTPKRIYFIKNAICKPDSEVEFNHKGYPYISKRSLTQVAKLWHRFITTRLLPTFTNYLVDSTRASLLYAIFEGQAINVGDTIKDMIRHCARHDGGEVWFPSLITNLIMERGIMTPPKVTGLLHSTPIRGRDALITMGDWEEDTQEEPEKMVDLNMTIEAIQSHTKELTRELRRLEERLDEQGYVPQYGPSPEEEEIRDPDGSQERILFKLSLF